MDDQTAKNGGIRCHGTSRQSGMRCKRWAKRGRRFCKIHGGNVKSGSEHPRFKHGLFSQELPPNLRGTYEALAQSPEYVELRAHIALVDTRLKDLIKRSNWGESAKKWKQAQETIRAALTFRDQGDEESLGEALEELAGILLGPSDHAAWEEIIRTLAERRKLTDSERRRTEAANQVITLSQFMSLCGAIGAMIRHRIEDATTKRELADDLRRLLVREGYTRGGETVDMGDSEYVEVG
jgi:hypothetical protein